MAENLSRSGFHLTVRDIDQARQERFAEEHGCAVALTPEAFADSEVVVTMLPDDHAVTAAVTDWKIAANLQKGAIIVDMSSSNPTATQILGAELRPQGIVLIDAPVSGGVRRAESGTLAIMIGGDDEASISRIQPLLAALGERLFRIGALGSAHAMKALNNYVNAASYTAGMEALAIGHNFGLDPETMVDVINASTGRSFATENVLKGDVVTGAYASGFALGLLAKDVGYAAKLAKATATEAPVCRVVSARWAEALDELGFAVDHSQAHKAWWSTEFAAQTGTSPGRQKETGP